MPKTKLEKVVVGTKQFGNKIDITDPCYPRSELYNHCRINDLAIKPGKYQCVTWIYRQYDVMDYVAILGIYLDGNIPARFRRIGSVCVDGGTVCVLNSPADISGDKLHSRFSKAMHNKKAAILPESAGDGFATLSGFGDWKYGVYAAKDKTGKIVALEVRFIDGQKSLL